MEGKLMARLGIDLMNLLFGRDWAEEEKLRGDEKSRELMGSIVADGMLIWILFTVFVWVDFTKSLLLNLGVVIGYPAILAFATIRTRRQVRKRKEAREQAKREATDHNDTQPPM